MKPTFTILLLLVTSGVGIAGEAAVEDFKKLKSRRDRLVAIENAPAEQKKQLREIDVHLTLIEKYRSEGALEYKKESMVAKARGLSSIEELFVTQNHYWDSYSAGVFEANEKSGMSKADLERSESELSLVHDELMNRLSLAHNIAFHLAASADALALENQIKSLKEDLDANLEVIVSVRQKQVTKEQLGIVNEQIDKIFERLKSLPSLDAKEVRKEYDAIREEDVL